MYLRIYNNFSLRLGISNRRIIIYLFYLNVITRTWPFERDRLVVGAFGYVTIDVIGRVQMSLIGKFHIIRKTNFGPTALTVTFIAHQKHCSIQLHWSNTIDPISCPTIKKPSASSEKSLILWWPPQNWFLDNLGTLVTRMEKTDILFVRVKIVQLYFLSEKTRGSAVTSINKKKCNGYYMAVIYNMHIEWSKFHATMVFP